MAFDTTEAVRALEMCGIAYRNETEGRAGSEQLELIDYAFFSGLSTQAYLARSGEQQFVVFRGTEADPVDWVTDARFDPRDGVFGSKVHSGFKLALDEVWPSIVEAIALSPLPVVFTGHSLGGALAALAAARHATAGGTVAAVYTFGQPRTGLGSFRAAYDAALLDVTHRVVNHIDLVTRVPLLVQRYRHVGRRMYFDEHGQFHENASAFKIASDDLKFRLRHFGRIKAAGLGPHMLGAYRRALARL